MSLLPPAAAAASRPVPQTMPVRQNQQSDSASMQAPNLPPETSVSPQLRFGAKTPPSWKQVLTKSYALARTKFNQWFPPMDDVVRREYGSMRPPTRQMRADDTGLLRGIGDRAARLADRGDGSRLVDRRRLRPHDISSSLADRPAPRVDRPPGHPESVTEPRRAPGER